MGPGVSDLLGDTSTRFGIGLFDRLGTAIRFSQLDTGSTDNRSIVGDGSSPSKSFLTSKSERTLALASSSTNFSGERSMLRRVSRWDSLTGDLDDDAGIWRCGSGLFRTMTVLYLSITRVSSSLTRRISPMASSPSSISEATL